MNSFIIPFSHATLKDLPKVGGKNASIGEMIQHLSPLGIKVPMGFAITADAYKDFISFNTLAPLLQDKLSKLNEQTLENLSTVSKECKALIMKGVFPEQLKKELRFALTLYIQKNEGISFAVRSSATAEDLPTASFAGQHDSFLNVRSYDDVLEAVQKCYASLFNERAIKYRIDNGVSHITVAQSVGVQSMVRADKGSAGVAFTLEPENGNENLIYITGSWGLGESVVQGAVNSDEFYLFKPSTEDSKNPIVYRILGSKEKMLIYGKSQTENTQWKSTPEGLRDQYILNDEELRQLGKWCTIIENHYNTPMDIEWAKDGLTDELYIVQARPQTVHGKRKKLTIKSYSLTTDEAPLLTGKAVGRKIVSGKVCIVKSLADSCHVKRGDIIVADITNPDWNALLKKAVCIVTNKGGRTSHASIVARELGIPAVVGTVNATEKLTEDQYITVSCASGDKGHVFDGVLEWEEKETPLEELHETHTNPMFILADPLKALLYSTYPNQGVGLLRMEFAITNTLQVHPMALVKFKDLPDTNEKKQISALTRHYADKPHFFVDKMAQSIALVAASFYPKEVIVRLSDFKTNEYAKLLGGKIFEPEEENPMLGFRGASRYYSDRYKEGFRLECEAINKVRNEMGLENVKVMIPFCRTPEEGEKVLQTMATFGLKRGVNNLEVYVMAEIPSNILLADKFAELFDGFSIGSNDLTQLTLGLDRDSSVISDLFDENNEAIKYLVRHLIKTAHHKGIKVGLCGQAPSDYPDYAKFLVNAGIDSISFNPDAIITGIENIMEAEKELEKEIQHS
jgi:pyruvate,water dikinase